MSRVHVQNRRTGRPACGARSTLVATDARRSTCMRWSCRHARTEAREDAPQQRLELAR